MGNTPYKTPISVWQGAAIPLSYHQISLKGSLGINLILKTIIMANFNGIFIGKVTAFQKAGQLTDANGHQNIILTPIAGKCPSKRVISGSLALTQGFVPGDVVAVSFTEGEVDVDYGRQFGFTNMGRLTTMETLGVVAQFGNPEIVDVEGDSKPEPKADIKEKTAGDSKPEPKADIEEKTAELVS
jgi:hypothetical protein